MGIFRSLVLLTVCIAFLSLGAACSEKTPPNQVTGSIQNTQPKAETKQEPIADQTRDRLPDTRAQQAESAPPKAMPKTLALTGTIEKAGEDVMLITDLGDYVVAGQDLSAMVGKSVNVTGAVEETGGKYTINVISFTEN